MTQSMLAARIGRATLAVDWAAVRWLTPIRAGLVGGVLAMLALVLVDAGAVVPIVVGALFVALADPRGAFPTRLRATVLTAVVLGAAATLGALAASPTPLRVLASGAAAFAFGYVGILGPRAAVGGVLGMVTFIIFAGNPHPAFPPLVLGAMMLLGGLVQAAVLVLPLLLGRVGGLREGIAVSYRTLGYALREGHSTARRASLAQRLLECTLLISESGARGPLRAWLDGLVACADGAHVAIWAAGPPPEPVARAASALAFQIAAALEIPARRRGLPARCGALEAAMREHGPGLPPERRAAFEEAVTALLRAAADLMAPWPLGRRGGYAPNVVRPPLDLRRLRAGLSSGNPFLRHAIRVSGVVMLATAIPDLAGFPHSYWLPMTVAWVSKPDFSGTAVKTAARLLGTLLGLVVVSAVLSAFGGSAWVVVPVIAVSGTMVSAFLLPNYALCTMGITMYVLAAFRLDGDVLRTDVDARAIDTLLAAALVLLAAWVWRTRGSEGLYAKLAGVAAALAAFADGVRVGTTQHGAVDAQRAEVLAAQAAAGTAIAAARLEPGDHAVHPDFAQATLDDLVDAYAHVIDAAEADGPVPGETDVARVRHLAERLREIEGSGATTPDLAVGPPATSRFAVALDRAHRRLDAVAS